LIDHEFRLFPSEFSTNKNSKRNININVKIVGLDANKLILEGTRELYNLEKNNTGYYYCREA
jgi:hypothetical protein